MRITIAERLRPFSHRPGAPCLIPGSALQVEVFPARLRVARLQGLKPLLLHELVLPLQGPMRQFTTQVDLEKGFLKVWGFCLEGFFSYRLRAFQGRLELEVEKGPKGLQALHGWSLEDDSCQAVELPLRRLSLGSHRKQDIDFLWANRDWTTLLPLFLRSSDYFSIEESCLSYEEGPFALLSACHEAWHRAHDQLYPSMEAFFLAALHGMCCPRLVDEQYQGIVFPVAHVSSNLSPLELLKAGASFLHSLFLHDDDEGLHLLPALPPQFHCGRYTGVCSTWGMVDLEWSKKTIRRVCFRSFKEGAIKLSCYRGVTSFRLRRNVCERGTRCFVDQALPIEEGQVYLLDRFEK